MSKPTLGPWTGARWRGGTFPVHTFEFEFPRLQTGKLTHREMEVITIEVTTVGLLGYAFSPMTGTWYQLVETIHSSGRSKARKMQELKPHQIPAVIKTHCLLLELA